MNRKIKYVIGGVFVVLGLIMLEGALFVQESMVDIPFNDEITKIGRTLISFSFFYRVLTYSSFDLLTNTIKRI